MREKKIMNRIRIYTMTEIEELLKNPNVECIINNSQIKYRNEFKLFAIMEKIQYPEKTAREIFEEAGFNMNIIDSRTPQRRLSSWLEKYYKFGEKYFNNENKYSYKTKETKLNPKKFLLIVHEDKYQLFPLEEINNEEIDSKN